MYIFAACRLCNKRGSPVGVSAIRLPRQLPTRAAPQFSATHSPRPQHQLNMRPSRRIVSDDTIECPTTHICNILEKTFIIPTRTIRIRVLYTYTRWPWSLQGTLKNLSPFSTATIRISSRRFSNETRNNFRL